MFSASRRSDNPEKKKKAVIQEANIIIIWPIMYPKRLIAAIIFFIGGIPVVLVNAAGDIQTILITKIIY